MKRLIMLAVAAIGLMSCNLPFGEEDQPREKHLVYLTIPADQNDIFAQDATASIDNVTRTVVIQWDTVGEAVGDKADIYAEWTIKDGEMYAPRQGSLDFSAHPSRISETFGSSFTYAVVLK